MLLLLLAKIVYLSPASDPGPLFSSNPLKARAKTCLLTGMDMYLLLRNNKQSGPYSIEDLKNMGLKAYDLVWSEGKSAAWRYPCELEELSAFAPPVEEQPFDRFYKRPAAVTAADATHTAAVAQTSATITQTSAITSDTPAATHVPAAPVYTGEPSAVPGKRIIYVTMPAGRTPAPVREIPLEIPHQPIREVPHQPIREVPHQPIRETLRETTPMTLREAPKEPAHANLGAEEYSIQLPSLEEQLVAVSPRSFWRRFGRLVSGRGVGNTRILRPVAIGACILALLAAGIFIGLSLNKNSSPLPQTIAARNPAQNKEQPTGTNPVQQSPVSPVNTALAANVTEKPKDSLTERAGLPSVVMAPGAKAQRATASKERQGRQKKGAIQPPAAKDSAAGVNQAAYPGVAKGAGVAKGDAVHRGSLTDKPSDEAKAENSSADKGAARPSISNQVSVGANGYTVGTFGGINDLQLTVTNRSVYPLDLVVVEVQFIQANKKVYKTENLYFRNIGAGSALMQEAPRSSRGIKVQYKIITVSSREPGLSYSGL